MAAGARLVVHADAAELMTSESLRHRLDSERKPAAFGNKQFAPEQQDALRRAFSQQSKRSLELFGDPRLKLPETSRLYRRAEDVLAMMRILHREFRWFGTPQAALVDSEAVSAGLQSLSWNLDYIHGQLKRIELIDAISGPYHRLLEDLHQLPTTPAEQLWDLVQQIALDPHQANDLPPAVPVSDFSLARYLQRTCKPALSQVMVSGIETALMISWLTRQVPEWRADQESLIAASLLADCGLVTLCSWSRITPAELQRNRMAAHHQHPSVGAAVAAGIKGLPVEIHFMVARHHERLDGSGYPAGLKSSEMSSTERLLAIVVRLAELANPNEEILPLEDAGAVMALKTSREFASAVACLQAEAEQGAWDQKLTVRVLRLMGCRELIAEETAVNHVVEDEAGTVPDDAGRGNDQFRRDAAHDGRPTGVAPRNRSRSGSGRSAMMLESAGAEVNAGTAPLVERGTGARPDTLARRGSSEP